MFTLNCNGRLVVADKPLVMGIVNATPDSFYEQSRSTSVEAIVARAAEMLECGADIIDIGGQSTRPGSMPIADDEELQRVIPAIDAVHKNFPESIISVDTYYSRVAKEAVGAGASIVNDISGGRFDNEMIHVVSQLNVPYVLMHMKGDPSTMQDAAVYDDVTKAVLDFFIQEVAKLTRAGIHDVIIDPGFGFAKTISHNFEILRNLSVFKMLECPILVGLSRKSTIYKTLHVDAAQALNGTTVLNTAALMNGAGILRVHDVKEAIEAVTLVAAMQKV